MNECFRAVWREIRALWRLSMRTLVNTVTASPSQRWQRAECFHHDHKARTSTVYAIDPAAAVAGGDGRYGAVTPVAVAGGSWIESELFDLGRNKMWYCTKCQQVWFLV